MGPVRNNRITGLDNTLRVECVAFVVYITEVLNVEFWQQIFTAGASLRAKSSTGLADPKFRESSSLASRTFFAMLPKLRPMKHS
jgi:hypothetical protein